MRSRANRAARILPSAPRDAEAARHEDAVHALEPRRRVGALEDLAFDPVELDAHMIGHAAVSQRLDQRLVGVLEPGVLADHRDRHLALGIVIGLGDAVPAAHIGLGRGLDAERGQHFAVEAGGVIERRHVIDRTRVARLDHRALAHVAEEARACAARRAESRDRSGRAGCAAGRRSSAIP